MHVNVLSTCVTSEREASTFDGFNHSVAASPFPVAPVSAAVASPVVSRGFLGLMKNIVGNRIREQPSSSAGSASKNESTVLDVHSYPARWRVVKLVAFELVRNDPGIMMTTTGTAAASIDSSSAPTGSSTKYKIGRRRDSSRSIVGDKLRKIRAMQNGVYKKIAWLPEWWWDLVPALSVHETNPAASGTGTGDVWDGKALSEMGEGFIEDDDLPQWTGTEESFLDEAGDSEQLSDPPATVAPLNSWTYSADCGTDWMPKDMVRIVLFCGMLHFRVKLILMSLCPSLFLCRII